MRAVSSLSGSRGEIIASAAAPGFDGIVDLGRIPPR
jgi:hypothetical protein